MTHPIYTHRTRDGRRVRLLCTDLLGQEEPVLAAVLDNDQEYVISYKADLKYPESGANGSDGKSPLDLVDEREWAECNAVVEAIKWQTAETDPALIYSLDEQLKVNAFTVAVQGGKVKRGGEREPAADVTDMERAEVARRLAASWKACNGVDVLDLEAGMSYTGLVEAYKKLTANRNQLLSALEMVIVADDEAIRAGKPSGLSSVTRAVVETAHKAGQEFA